MTKQFWLSLPVKDIARSKDFFSKMGFRFNTKFPENPCAFSLMIGEQNTVVMIVDEPTFQSYTGGHGIANARQATEVLLSIDAQSKEEVDQMAQKAIDAGGSSNHQPSEMTGWMYGCLFVDPDGHQWNVLYMDMSKMPS